MGHQVTVAEHGGVALDLAGRRLFDVIVMDMQMPVRTARKTARALRAGTGRTATPPSSVSPANAFASDRRACLDAGMDEFLANPSRGENSGRACAISRVLHR